MTEFVIRPPNSIIFVSDQNWSGDPPDHIEESHVTATSECLVIWTRAESDGSTKLIINQPSIMSRLHASGTYKIETPTQIISISDSHASELASFSAVGDTVRVEVYLDDFAEPSVIGIIVK